MGDSVSDPSNDQTISSAQGYGPPPKLEVLGEHLYAKVTYLQDMLGVQLDIAKLTGILLELGEKQVLKLLEDETLLQEGVKRVIHHVPTVCQSTLQPSHRRKEGEEADGGVEEELYSQVWRLEPALATHITGMLLELGSTQVNSLLDSPTRLTQAVLHAKDASRQKHSSDHSMADQEGQEGQNGVRDGVGGKMKENSDDCDDGNNDVTEEMEMLGEMVYAEAERLYPHSAAKLTGMVLDMGVDRVKILLQDMTQLHTHLHKAFTSLSTTPDSDTP